MTAEQSAATYRSQKTSSLEEGVPSELVSENQNSPASWENTATSKISHQKYGYNQKLRGKIPYAAEQGINSTAAGN
jgi:hypothetical protein